MPMFSDEIGTLVADLARRRGARQESNADARARETLLSQIQAPLFAQAAEAARREEEAARAEEENQKAQRLAQAEQMGMTGKFGFTPAPSSTVTPMLTGLQPIVDNPTSASQSGSFRAAGPSAGMRGQAESLLFPMLTKQENRDLGRKTAELDQLVRARPGLVSRMYGGEEAAKPIDARIKELQGEIEKGQQSNEKLQTNQMLTGQRLISSYSTAESQAARIEAATEAKRLDREARASLAAGKLNLDWLKLYSLNIQRRIDAQLKQYGIDAGIYESPAALSRDFLQGRIGAREAQMIQRRNELATGTFGFGKTLNQIMGSPEDFKNAVDELGSADYALSQTEFGGEQMPQSWREKAARALGFTDAPPEMKVQPVAAEPIPNLAPITGAAPKASRSGSKLTVSTKESAPAPAAPKKGRRKATAADF